MRPTVSRWACVVALTVVSFGTALPGCRGKKPPTTAPAGPEPLLVYVGNSMRQPMVQCIETYENRAGERITPTYGDSAEILSQVKLTGRGEAAILHEPFMTQAHREGWATRTHVIAHMTPVVAVARGNPRNVKGLKDFVREDLKIGLTDARYTTSGQLAQEALKAAGIQQQVMARRPVENRSSGFLATQVAAGALDAATIWDAVAAQRAGDLDIVPIEPGLLPERFTDEENVVYAHGRVPVGLFELKTARHAERTAAFIRFLLSDEGQAIWKAHGFTRAAAAPATGPADN